MSAAAAQLKACPIERPLCVDLDGTLIHSDTLAESVLALLRQRPWLIFVLPLWLLTGKAQFKRKIALRASLPVEQLPYDTALITYLKAERVRGRCLVLATGADRQIAERVASYLGIFSEVLASDGAVNLVGTAKLRALQERFGATGFGYAGNSQADLPIWRHAEEVLAVNASPSVQRALADRHPVVIGTRSRWRALLRACRLHQWAKNALLAAPPLLAHKLFHLPVLLETAVAMVSFSLCASTVYLVNDLLDLEADRVHPQKRRRPLASGEVTVPAVASSVVLFGSAGLILGALLGRPFFFMLLVYAGLTLGYSLCVKKIPLMDVILLALFYTIRLQAGALATHVPISHWLLQFSIFLFFSLALVKRTSELRNIAQVHGADPIRRGYVKGDIDQLASFGTASGYVAVVVFGLYLSSPEVRVLYRYPEYLWGAVPLLLYWISRVWLLTLRGVITEDPVVFALQDRVSYAVGAAIAVVLLIAKVL